jgi:hypothetical protein
MADSGSSTPSETPGRFYVVDSSKMVVSQSPFIAVPFVGKRKKVAVSPMGRRGAGQAGIRITPNLSPVASSRSTGPIDALMRMSQGSSKQTTRISATAPTRSKTPKPKSPTAKHPEKLQQKSKKGEFIFVCCVKNHDRIHYRVLY